MGRDWKDVKEQYVCVYIYNSQLSDPDVMLPYYQSCEAKVKRIKMLVLDEADEMLSKGFKEQVETSYRSQRLRRGTL